jgi:hypothetical protein
VRVLAHGRTEVLALADRCNAEELDDVNGWSVDLWRMDDDDVASAVAVYEAVLLGGATDAVVTLLDDAGLDLSALLLDEDRSKDDITRSDLTELTAAATLIALDACDVDLLQMPNVPKMSRRKSDSGIDIFEVVLDDDESASEIGEDERLTIASVKHSVNKTSTAGLRWKLADSLSEREITVPYMTGQLRVLNGRLRQEGRSEDSAARVYLFLRDFPALSSIHLIAVGVVSPELEDDLKHHVSLLPDRAASDRTFRIILLPDLENVQDRCP